ncbi:Histone-lysine N-methyltransferase SMYD3 [Eumeta japonica]|uniref:Histone-lysine N-methyltransferase SMYD3 n=1 Tax=Eumeta variegata TaxID=151549 RepID=A0A4C1ZNG3_EUMVA|nr:Histone-lysine N-methyltransferase SMYD3 [Eumeta japonica]
MSLTPLGDPLTVRSVHTEIKIRSTRLTRKFVQDDPARRTSCNGDFGYRRIRISYIDLMKTPYERQTELLQSYYFLCQCDSWYKPYLKTLVRLHNDEKFAGGWTCQWQQLPLICHFQRYCQSLVHDLNVDVCKYCLERQEGVLHPLNVMHAQTLDHAFDALIEVQLWEQACEYATQLIPCFRFYYGELHPLLGLLHLKYGKILLYKMELNKALDQFKTAEKILKITHGDKHPLYRQELLPLLKQVTLESV